MRRTAVVALLLALTAALMTPVSAQTGNRFVDDEGSVHEALINAIAAEGITQGCNAGGFFCPEMPITRAQMASFLARALSLAGGADAFSDDDGLSHEPRINAIAAEGITVGCDADGRAFCPYRPVTRAQMATFLVRALELPPPMENHFSDDDGLSHEPAINSLADAGITNGCRPSEFCPLEPVTREQMASFLGRALDLEPVYAFPDLSLVEGFTRTCDSLETRCSGLIVVPKPSNFVVSEGWFYNLPYLSPEDQALFLATQTRFDLRVDGKSPSALAVETSDSTGQVTRVWRYPVIGLIPGTHQLVGSWSWGGRVTFTTTLTVIVQG